MLHINFLSENARKKVNRQETMEYEISESDANRVTIIFVKGSTSIISTVDLKLKSYFCM